jgi:ABC-type lipoprotein export system ATPase subunit
VQKNNIIYNIRDLNCSYSSSKRPVLEIKELKIERGDRVFFIGASGVGKSTILESLGLMNNTITLKPQKESVLFELSGENILDIWNKSESALMKKRNENFSFIFQSNNLFSSMNGYQNIISGAIIKGNNNITDLKKRAALLVKDLLSDKNIKDEKSFNILEMSGGQKQRLAFARAIIADKDILFADEPTGNLDWFNAERLMIRLDKELGDDKTAIIVTHDVNLALKFANKIIVIDKKYDDQEDAYYGHIDCESLYIKKGKKIWKNLSIEKESSEVLEDLRNKFIYKD